MPIRFACPHCRQRLTVSARKAGSEATCPRCQGQVSIPGAAEPVHRGASPPSPPPLANDAELPASLPRIIPLDDRPQLIYETEDEPPADLAQVDFDRVSVPRWAIYTQGALLGVVALFSFILGVVIGSSFTSQSPTENVGAQPCEITGTITFAGGGGKHFPDDGAVVIALPQDEHPDEKASVEGLRPGDLADANARGERMIQLWRGGIARADPQGRYRLKLPGRGKHFLLVVSHHGVRGVGKAPETSIMQQMGRFFEAPSDLIAGKNYSWELKHLRGDIQYNKTFD